MEVQISMYERQVAMDGYHCGHLLCVAFMALHLIKRTVRQYQTHVITRYFTTCEIILKHM